jgi:hypothetical protein
MNKIKKERTSNPPKWFTFWVQNDFAPFKEKVERIEKRLDNIETDIKDIKADVNSIVTKNNLKR